MSPVDPRSNDQYTLTFTSNKLLMGICGLLLLMVLCTMLGIRIERYQQQQAALLEARAGMAQAMQGAGQLVPDVPPPAPRPTTAAPAPMPVRTITAADLSDAVPPAPTPTLLAKASEPRTSSTGRTTIVASKPLGSSLTVVTAKPTTRTTIASTTQAPSMQATSHRAGSQKFVVQVVSSRDEALANARAHTLARQGVPAFVETADLGGKGTWYRVLAGTYPSKTEANATLSKLQRDPQFEASFVRTY